MCIFIINICITASDKMIWLFLFQILLTEIFHNLFWCHFTLAFCNCLDYVCKFLMHPFWQLKAKISIHYKSYSTFSRLAVNPYYRLIFPANIHRVNWQVRDCPNTIPTFLHCCNTFINRILVRARKCSKYKLPSIWVANMHWNLTAALIHFYNLINMP